jgi:flagellar protein FlbD
MIQLTRINHVPLVLNSDLIEHIESSPDTIISLTNGQKLVVLETVDDIVRKVVKFRRMIQAGLSGAVLSAGESPETEPHG